jgi:hypothetical protein
MTLKRDWYAGLRDEMETEIRKGLHKARRAGRTGWGDSRKKRVKHDYVVKPLFPSFTTDDEHGGRSLTYHNEQVADKVARHEAGQSLWSDGEADTETFEGTELRDSEKTFIGSILDMRDAHLQESSKKKWVRELSETESFPGRMLA